MFVQLLHAEANFGIELEVAVALLNYEILLVDAWVCLTTYQVPRPSLSHALFF
jgi:hypothetical protein